MRAAKEVKRRDNSLEALSTTPGGRDKDCSLPLLGAGMAGLLGQKGGFHGLIYVKRSEKQPYGWIFFLIVLKLTYLL